MGSQTIATLVLVVVLIGVFVAVSIFTKKNGKK